MENRILGHQTTMDKDKEKEIKGIESEQYLHAAKKDFVSGKTKNTQTEMLHKLLATTPPMRLVREKRPKRNEPCPCGSGKKYKKCCQIFTADKLVMKKETEDWSIEATAKLRIDNRTKSKEVLSLQVSGTLNGPFEIGHIFDLGEVHIKMQGEAEITHCADDVSTFIVKDPCSWPREWNEEWAR